MVRMIWWFLIFAFSAGAVLWASISAYLRVRRHMKVGVSTSQLPEEYNSEER
jgi:hypothetical protein